jgi:hypothetical protein
MYEDKKKTVDEVDEHEAYAMAHDAVKDVIAGNLDSVVISRIRGKGGMRDDL